MAYQVALQHLSLEELDIACTEVMKTAKFFPNPAEILAALAAWKDRQPLIGTAHAPSCTLCVGSGWKTVPAPLAGYPDRVLGVPCREHVRSTSPELSSSESKAILRQVFDVIGKIKEPHPEERWTAEDGWLPREESWRREEEREMRKGVAPRFNVVDGRIAAVAQREPGDD